MGTKEKKPPSLTARIRTAINTLEAEQIDAIFLIMVLAISTAIILALNATGYSW